MRFSRMARVNSTDIESNLSIGGSAFMKITRSDFGTTPDGSGISLYHLENVSGAYVEIIDYGCRLTKIVVPDHNGSLIDVCLG